MKLCSYYKTLASGHQQKYMGKKNGKEIWKYVHRLEAAKKNGGALPDGAIVHHRDGNPSHNGAGNLQVTTKAGHNKIDKKHHLGGRKKETK